MSNTDQLRQNLLRAIEARAATMINLRDAKGNLDEAVGLEKHAAEFHAQAGIAEHEARTAFDNALYEEARA